METVAFIVIAAASAVLGGAQVLLNTPLIESADESGDVSGNVSAIDQDTSDLSEIEQETTAT